MSCLTPKLNLMTPCDVTIFSLDNTSCAVPTLTEGIGTLIFNDGQGGISIVDSDEVETAVYDETTELLTLTKKSGETVTATIPQGSGGSAPHTHTQPTLVFNVNGTMTFTDGNGVETILPNDDVVSGIYNSTTGQLTLTKRSGGTVVIDLTGLQNTLVAKRYTQTIPAGTTTITVTHSLPTASPIVQIIDSTGSIVDYTITGQTANTFVLTFNPATTSLTNVVVI